MGLQAIAIAVMMQAKVEAVIADLSIKVATELLQLVSLTNVWILHLP